MTIKKIEKLDILSETVKRGDGARMYGYLPRDESLDIVEEKINELVEQVNTLTEKGKHDKEK